MCILATGFLFRPYMFTANNGGYDSYLQHKGINSEIDAMDDTEVLTWDMYHKYCFTDTTSNANQIGKQLRCSHLDNINIYWDGAINEVSIVSIKNWRRDLIQNYLPKFLADLIACYFGEINSDNCHDGEECEGVKEFLETHKKCNLDRWNM